MPPNTGSEAQSHEPQQQFFIHLAEAGFAPRPGLRGRGGGIRVALGVDGLDRAGLPTYITFYPAVMVAALLAGFGPGLLATALTGLSVAYWVLPPEGFAISSTVDRVGLVLFAGMGLFMSTIAELYRRDRRKAAAYDQEMALRESRETLRQSEARLAGIIGSAMDAIISVDADQRIVLFNAAAENMFRCSTAEALGQPLDRFIPIRYRASHREHMRSFSATGVTARTMAALGALSGLRADGQEFPIEASISQGNVKGQKLFTVILRDITERQLAEAALKKANEELEQRVAERTSELQAAFRYARSLLEASLDPLVTISPEGKSHRREQSHRIGDGRAARAVDRHRFRPLLHGAAKGGSGLSKSPRRRPGARLSADHLPRIRPHHRRALQRHGLSQ